MLKDHYKTLGVNSSATQDEIRRAYRILARRYHPDVNPGKSSEDKFKDISSAYEVLSDPKSRKSYDAEYDRMQIASFAEKFTAQFKDFASKSYKRPEKRKSSPASGQKPKEKENIGNFLKNARNKISSKLHSAGNFFKKQKLLKNSGIASVSIIEISVTIREAIFGLKKTIEIPKDNGKKKISVTVPAGVRSGSVLRLRQTSSKSGNEEIVLIIRVAQHPFLSIQNRGLLVEVPVSVQEALMGSNITLPTLDDPVLVKIPASSQSGTEIRIKDKGILFKDGSRGDMIYRLLVKLPQASTAVGIKEKAAEIDKYYEEPVRRAFPSSFNDI